MRALVNHLLFWGPSLAGAGRKESVPRPAAAESDVDLAAGDWRGRLLTLLGDITSSWAPPSAWEGETSMGTPHMLPAPVMGDMIVGELAVHGWDLAVATGQRQDLPAGLLCSRKVLEEYVVTGRWPESMEGWRRGVLHDRLAPLLPG